MLRRTAIPAALVAAALLASAACSNDGADKGSAGANPTLATDPPRTNPTVATVPPATTTTNPYAVPAVIDAAYVNRVLAKFDGVLGDVTRQLIQTKTFPAEAFDRLKALYGTNQWLQLKVDAFQTDLSQGFSNYKSVPGNKTSAVTRLFSSSPSCIFAEVRRDYADVTVIAPPSAAQWVVLKPLDRSRDPNNYNPTGWALFYDGAESDRSQPPNPC